MLYRPRIVRRRAPLHIHACEAQCDISLRCTQDDDAPFNFTAAILIDLNQPLLQPSVGCPTGRSAYGSTDRSAAARSARTPTSIRKHATITLAAAALERRRRPAGDAIAHRTAQRAPRDSVCSSEAREGVVQTGRCGASRRGWVQWGCTGVERTQVLLLMSCDSLS